jgi:hypothetical protein
MRIATKNFAVFAIFAVSLLSIAGCEDTDQNSGDVGVDSTSFDAADTDTSVRDADGLDGATSDGTSGDTGGDTGRDSGPSDGGGNDTDENDADAAQSDSGDAAYADASDSSDSSDSSDAADTSDAGVTDPFDPQSCSGTAWTAADALARLGGSPSELLDTQTVMERHRTCDSSGCGPWSTPAVNEISYLTWSGGVSTHYKTLQTDTSLVLFDDAGTPKLSVRHDTHLAHYPDDHDEGLVFGLAPTTIAYPMMRAWNVSPASQYYYRDLENYIGRDAQLFVSPNCARFVSVLPDRSSDVHTEYVAVYRF